MRSRLFAICLLSLFASAGYADEAEDTAVEFVEKLGGSVVRNDKAKGKPAISVNREYKRITDAGLKELAALKQLQTLRLDYTTKVTDLHLLLIVGNEACSLATRLAHIRSDELADFPIEREEILVLFSLHHR